MSAKLRTAGDIALGVILCALIIGASAAIDISSAWHLSAVNEERYVLVAVALVAVLWKAIGSIKIASLWGDRRYGAMVAPALLLVLAITVSISMEVRFYKRVFGDAAEGRQVTVDKRKELRRDIAALDAQIADRGTPSSEAEMQAQIDSLLGRIVPGDPARRTIDVATESCTNTKSSAFVHCGEVLTLRTGAERAIAVNRLVQRRDEKRSELEKLPPISVGDGLAETVSDLTGSTREQAIGAVVILIMALIQIGCIGFPLAYFGAGRTPPRAPDVRRSANEDANSTGDKLSPVDAVERQHAPALRVVHGGLAPIEKTEDKVAAFVRSHLVAKPGHRISAHAVHSVFAVVTRSDLAQRAFGKMLQKVIVSDGIDVNRTRSSTTGHTFYVDIGLSAEGERILEAIERTRQIKPEQMRLISATA